MKPTRDIVPESLRKYVGLAPWLDDPMARARLRAFTLGTESLAGPNTPFGRTARNTLLLCDQTRDLLYAGDFGRIDQPYLRGSRPLLEAWVDRCVKPGMSAGDLAIALSQSLTGDLQREHMPSPVFLYGESDEQTILKGGGHCSCKARLLTALCQVAGLQARPAMFWTWVDDQADPDTMLGGHTVTEVLIDGRWGFFDPQQHRYCRTADGRFPSIAEIRADPQLYTRMPADVLATMDTSPDRHTPADADPFEHYWYRYFNPKCPVSISRHDVNDPGVPRWFWATAEVRDHQGREYRQRREIFAELARRGDLDERVYTLPLGAFRAAFGITNDLMPAYA